MNAESARDNHQGAQAASKMELNSWRRGFTPQAEIWNGRMAMFATIIVFSFLLLLRNL
tara:strand:- start:526 stop:699 length:174 start_codon:yes stop_codon:yes gene_type:complete